MSVGVTWTMLEAIPRRGRLRWVDTGSFDPTPSGIEAFAHFVGLSASLVGLEYASGAVYEPFRATTLLEQNFVAGMIAMAIRWPTPPPRVLRMTAPRWRKALTGKASIGPRKDGQTFDELIAQAVAVNVTDVPRSNAHARDAAGIAVVAARAVERRMVRDDGLMESL